MSTIKDNFYLRLRDERDRLALSQSAIAEKCLVSRVIWGRYESGSTLPGADVLMRLADLGGDVLYLLTGERGGGVNKSFHEGATYTKQDVAELADVFAHTNDEGRQALMSLARFIKNK